MMKYGIWTKGSTVKKRGFTENFWEDLISRPNNAWKPLPKKNVFISFNEVDRNWMKSLKKELEASELLKPIVVEDKRDGLQRIQDLVVKGIKESDYFVPIITRKSMKTQWVNQEIGFASARQGLEILPILQRGISKDLRGFIHNQQQIAYQFEINSSAYKSRASFRKFKNELLEYLEGKQLKNIEIK